MLVTCVQIDLKYISDLQRSLERESSRFESVVEIEVEINTPVDAGRKLHRTASACIKAISER